MTRPNILANSTPLFCDLYHLTMAQAWFSDGKANETKTSECYFRKCPFNGNYLLSAGLAEFSEWIENWHFSDEDIKYLQNQTNADGSKRFNDDFLNFIKNQPLQINIDAVEEGEIVFPNEPVYSITGPTWQVDMVEAALLNIFNSQSLIATKASRIVLAASSDGKNRPVLEFGLRRGQELGGFSSTRACFIGGMAGTSNVAAAQHYDIPVSGTMAHSFIMSYEDEIDAYKAYLRASQGNTTLLVDTYETSQGIKNAIKASQETNIPLQGIRIDSGDLAYWGKEARKILDDAGFNHTKIIASNDLDEYSIKKLVEQGTPYDIFAAGTKVVTAYDNPALGGVFKTKQYAGRPVIKVAEGKTTIPNKTNVLRVIRGGKYGSDIIQSTTADVIAEGKLTTDIKSFIIGSNSAQAMCFAKGEEAYTLLKPLMRNGKFVKSVEKDLKVLQAKAKDNLQKLDNKYKKIKNSTVYQVGIENSVYTLQQNLIKLHQGR
ncbi:MAG: nicotinate phosphoribosyltransferase [Alphaproteobacteria bacterium]|nr:nicotinate phosphoribosyltransferase [Alphaproteobacteria bacterium]